MSSQSELTTSSPGGGGGGYYAHSIFETFTRFCICIKLLSHGTARILHRLKDFTGHFVHTEPFTHFRSVHIEMTNHDGFKLFSDSGFANGQTTSLLYAKWRRGKERPTMVAINRVKIRRLKAFQTQLISLPRVH